MGAMKLVWASSDMSSHQNQARSQKQREQRCRLLFTNHRFSFQSTADRPYSHPAKLRMRIVCDDIVAGLSETVQEHDHLACAPTQPSSIFSERPSTGSHDAGSLRQFWDAPRSRMKTRVCCEFEDYCMLRDILTHHALGCPGCLPPRTPGLSTITEPAHVVFALGYADADHCWREF
ncbi:unnamed protein product [Mycena citricolor]|uniref:Uncharacterized protein n=1 Tax=Mycena citricolor TaxID=2018698 RepID=A0AAD2K051_9AGAR|nr:unnamed protein product [Mycena citricolor]